MTRLASIIEEEFGGLDFLIITHKDNVAFHDKWKERFPKLQRVMHKTDARYPSLSEILSVEHCNIVSTLKLAKFFWKVGGRGRRRMTRRSSTLLDTLRAQYRSFIVPQKTPFYLVAIISRARSLVEV